MTSGVGPGPVKTRVAVVTHARKEPLFCTLWSEHYGRLFGHESLVLYKDGEDWELPAEARFGAVRPVEFPKSRTECDAYFAKFLAAECARLLQDHDVVLRTDVDEFLVVDPASGTWDEVFAEVQAQGYLYALGLDVVQNPAKEGPLDLWRPILAQRRFAYVRGDYCKPCVIARPVTWTSACHTVEDGPVVLSKSLKLIHLASMDRELLEQRLTDRGDFTRASYAGHAKSRFRQFATVGKEVAYELDAVDAAVRQRLCLDDDGMPALSPRFSEIVAPDGSRHGKSLCVRLPERYAPLIAGPEATAPRHAKGAADWPAADVDRLALLQELLRPDRLTVIADVGASGIEKPPYAFLLAQGACSVWGFEPQPEEYAKLVASAGPNEHYLQQAVGDGTMRRLYLTKHPGFSSTLKPNRKVSQALQRWKKDTVVTAEIDLQTVRLDDLAGLPGIDLLKIDVQGGEVAVFENAVATLSGAVAVLTETAAIPIYEGQPLLGDQMLCLARMGFHLHKFSFFRSVPFRGALAPDLPWRRLADQLSDGDAIFVRGLFDLDAQGSEWLKHLALLADFVFASPSLALKAVEVLVGRGDVDAVTARAYAGLIAAKYTAS